MSDFERNDELKRKYGEVMDSIADDINQINNAPDSSDGFIRAVSDVDFDNPDDVLNSVGYSDNENIVSRNSELSEDTAPLFNDIIFENEFGVNEESLFDSIARSNIDLSSDFFADEPDTLSCDECRDLLYDYVSDLTDETESKAIKIHLNNCEMCRVELDDIRDMIAVMSSSPLPEVPINLMDGLHKKLVQAAPEVKAEYKEIKGDKNVLDTAKNALVYAKNKTDYFVKHANWKVLAPAALSAVLVVGVASSGLYQVMKSSDEIYDFSNDAAIASAKATARPSASGLDEYVDGKSKSASSPKSTTSPRNTASPSGSKSVSPRATTTPSASSSSGLPNLNSSSGTSSSSSRNSSSSSSSSSNRASSSTSSSGRTTTSSSNTSSSSNRVSTPTPTPKPYVMPNIILPDIASIMNNNSSNTAIPELPVQPTETTEVWGGNTVSDDNSAGIMPTSDEALFVTASGGGGGASASDSEKLSNGNSGMSASVPTEAPKPVKTAAPTTTADAAAAPTATAIPLLAPLKEEVKRNENGETELYVEKALLMENASIVECTIESREMYNDIIRSSMVLCSKLEENNDLIVYLTGSEFAEFTKFLKENDLDYTLMSLGNNEDVKVILHAPKEE